MPPVKTASLKLPGATPIIFDGSNNAAFPAGISGPNFNPFGLAQYQDAAYLQGYSFYTDMFGETPNTISGVTATAGAGFGTPTPGGSESLPPSILLADIAQHIGVAYVYTGTTGDYQYVTTGQNYLAVYPGSPPHGFELRFFMPHALSNATDRYVLSFGWFYNSNPRPYHGISLGYTDNVNSGQWVCYEHVGGAANALALTGVAPVAGSWNKLLWTISGNKHYVTLNGVSLCSGVSSPNLSSGSPLTVLLGGLQMQRSSAGSGNPGIAALVDASQIYVSGTTRT